MLVEAKKNKQNKNEKDTEILARKNNGKWCYRENNIKKYHEK